MSIVIKRIYDEEANDDGYRILVDRLWPRGVSKERADLDDWMKDVSPSPDLRKWFDHRSDRFSEFKAKYLHELSVAPEKQGDIAEIRGRSKEGKVTLLYGAKDPNINHAIVLLEFLKRP